MIGMAKFVKKNGDSVWVNPNLVAVVDPHADYTGLILPGGREFQVIETLGDVLLALDEVKRQTQGQEQW